MYAPVDNTTTRSQIVTARMISLAATIASLLISLRVFMVGDEGTGIEGLLITLSPVVLFSLLCILLSPDGSLLHCPRYLAYATFGIAFSVSWPRLLAAHGSLGDRKERTMAWIATISVIATTATHCYHPGQCNVYEII